MIDENELKDLLVESGLLSSGDFDNAQKKAVEKNIPLEDYLPQTGFITDSQLGQLIADYYDFNFVDLNKTPLDEDAMHTIPEIVAQNKGIIVFGRNEDKVKLGMLNPADIEALYLVKKRLGQDVLPFYITKNGFKGALKHYKGSLKEEFEIILDRLKDEASTLEERDGATVEVVDTLLQYANQSKVSDIHIEPYHKKVGVRFRIDGVMHDVLDLPKDLFDLVLIRIKILAKLRTDEHMAAQDGKLRFSTSSGKKVDVRVSIVPVIGGENVVMRLLSSENRLFNLSSLGLEEGDLQKVEKAIKHPHGMILVTGPTGSGKSTTLYAVMNILNKREVHISTIEDPVEYDIGGVSQIQVNPKTDLTFAKGLRAIVRQDPDIIMVGEIRDSETAGIAVNSAMTGHLVLSTLHTNNAATTLPRLLDMGIEPFLVASTVQVIIAQRLVRQICGKCRVSYGLEEEDKKIFEGSDDLKKLIEKKDLNKLRLYKGKGCKMCGGTGYSGRVGIFEVLEMTDDVKNLVIKRASSDEIVKVAEKNGMTRMFEDGIAKVLEGITTLDEVMRVTVD